eukprot:786309-Pyramimonas_sp.AAC.1
MVDVNKAVDVGVIDEIQMMSDASRGWAWTRALYGLPARELHLCGDPTALPLIQKVNPHPLPMSIPFLTANSPLRGPHRAPAHSE